MKKIILSVVALSLLSNISMASNLFCDSRKEFRYSELIFKKDNRAESGFIVLVDTTSGKRWVKAYEGLIEKRNGFRLRGIVEERMPFEACGELNSDGLSISKISTIN